MAERSDNQTGRRLAHERLSTGALARWARMCASHPWRVIFGSLASIALLFVLVATIGGSLKDVFEIPGSDTQKATDLIESKFSSEQGAVLNLVFAAPKGERLDTPERKAAVERSRCQAQVGGVQAQGGQGGHRERRRPVLRRTRSPTTDASRTPRRSSRRRSRPKIAPEVVAVEDAVATRSKPAGVTAEFNGDAEFPPIQQGIQELLGFLAAFIVLMIVFRTFVATSIPIALALLAVGTAFLLLFILAGLTDINTITPILVSMIGIGVGIDYSLFIVTRFRQHLHEGLSPVDAAARLAPPRAGPCSSRGSRSRSR